MLNRRRPAPSAPAPRSFVPDAGGSALVMLVPDTGAGTVTARVQDPREPALLVTDQGVTRGDGIFETMMATPGQGQDLSLIHI